MQLGTEQRQAASRQNMLTIFKGLTLYAENHGNSFPDDPHILYDKYVTDLNTFTSPLWPDETAYTYVSGVQKSDAPTTILLIENAPAQKARMGRHVLMLDGHIEHLLDTEAASRLSAQEEKWKAAGRRWKLVPIELDKLKKSSD